MKKFFNEFIKFASRGDVMNLAIGILIGGAFQSIVNSLVKDIISPLLGLFVNINLDYLLIRIGEVEIKYGAFITAIINFFIMSFIIFCIIKILNTLNENYNKLLGKNKVDKKPTTKICPFCKSEINIDATKCPHCTSNL